MSVNAPIATTVDVRLSTTPEQVDDPKVFAELQIIYAAIRSLQATSRGGGTPCFSAYPTVSQSIPSYSYVKLNFQVVEFDITSAFDSITNMRFTPKLPGYYQVNGSLNVGVSSEILLATVYKNGTEFKRGNESGTAASSAYGATVSALIPLNGSTDYIELWGLQCSGAPNSVNANSIMTYFQASFIRSL
jgi:hypothetical protein